MMKKIALLAVLLCGLSFPAFAGYGPGYFKLSLWDDIAFSIPGNIYDIKGVDLGIGSVANDVTGVQADLIWAQTARLTGLSYAWGISKVGYGTGAQIAFVNMNVDLTGAQLGAVNMSSRSVVGTQIGFYNQAEYVNGIQFGLVNYAKYIYGLQLGIFNIAENGFLPAMIFINGRF